MLNLTLGRPGRRRLEVLCIGAHCDDIEIGCGGAVLSLQQRYPDCRIHWFVLTSTDVRRREALAGASSFVSKSARGEVCILDLPDGLLPSKFAELKAAFETLKAAVVPDLIFTHHLEDRHQDHRLVGEVTWQTFRNHLIWEYEIPKYEGDQFSPNVYVPLMRAHARRKITLVTRIFESQSVKSWFNAETLEAALRLRGLEVRSASGLAEAFHCRKMRCGFSSSEAAHRSR